MVKRSRTTPTSSSTRNTHPDETIDEEERSRLLDTLNSHGQSFLNAFELPAPSTGLKASKKKRKLQESQDTDSAKEAPNPINIPQSPTNAPSVSVSRVPDVVVFDARSGMSSQPLARGNGKGFMSSKIRHVREYSQPGPSKPTGEDEESDEEMSNTRNDKLLHELVHSQLLNDPNAFDAKRGSAKRSRTVAGRLLELADDAKTGRGSAALKAQETARHAQRVRLGMRDKAKQREARSLEEAKALGNYHPSIKRNFQTLSSGAAKQRRERGLALGIGKFRNGALTLSKGDLRSVEGATPGGGSRGVRAGKRR